MNQDEERVVVGWKDIETAPKGKHVLVWDGIGVSISFWGKVSHVPIYGWLWLYADCEDISLMDPKPTHWMPLPPPPNSQE